MNKYRFFSILVIISMLINLFSLTCLATGETMIYVSPNGSDSYDGLSASSPFKSIEAARDKVRLLKNANPNQSFIVNLMGGEYNISSQIAFNSLDAGSEQYPITYKAYNEEKVTITSNYSLSVNSLTTVTNADILARIPEEARGYVKQANLSQAGITSSGSAWGYGDAPNLILFADDELQTIARYPNEGFMYTGSVVSSKSPTSFVYTDDRLERSFGSTTAKLYGAFEFLWYWRTRTITSYDTINKSITLSAINVSYEARPNLPYFVYNLLEELDIPGEYFIDYTNKILYYYPKDNVNSIKFSKLKVPLVYCENTSNISFENIDFSISSDVGISMSGCSNMNVQNCNFYNLGSNAIIMSDSQGNTIADCNVYNNGKGIIINGGDRQTLTGSNSVVTNCDVYNTNMFVNTGAGISVGGVGVSILNNKIHDLPHQAIGYSGNNHIFRGNEIYNVCTMASDAGAIYAGRDWTYRGTVISENYFHHINGYNNEGGVQAVYFDDMMSGNTVENNIFAYCNNGVLIHGGKDTIIQNNLFYVCNSSVKVPDFSKMGTEEYFNTTTGTFYTKLQAVPFSTGVWYSQYPELNDYYYAEPPYTDEDSTIGYATNNYIHNNIIYTTPKVSMSSLAKQYSFEYDNIIKQMVMYKN